MPSIQDWAAKAAQKIHTERYSSVERKAAIIATFAEPLLKLLAESRCLHTDRCDAFQHSEEVEEDENCTCGATEWNKRIRTVLNGN